MSFLTRIISTVRIIFFADCNWKNGAKFRNMAQKRHGLLKQIMFPAKNTRIETEFSVSGCLNRFSYSDERTGENTHTRTHTQTLNAFIITKIP